VHQHSIHVDFRSGAVRQLWKFLRSIMDAGRCAKKQKQAVCLSWRRCDDQDALQRCIFSFSSSDFHLRARGFSGFKYVGQGVLAFAPKCFTWCRWPNASQHLSFRQAFLPFAFAWLC
jgi:hypothetical protein